MFNKILGILDNHNKKNILILFLLYFPLNFIEAFSITSIPGFVLLISEPEKIQEFLPEYNLSNLLTQLNLNERVTYGTVLIVLIFFFRAIIMIFVNWFDYTIRYKINVQNSKKLYSSYINKPYLFHVNNSSSTLIQNMNDSIRSTGVIFAFLNIVKDFILLLFIVFAIYISSPSNFLNLIIFILVPVIILFFVLKKIIRNMGIVAREYRVFSHNSISQGFLNIKFIKIMNNELDVINDFTNKHKISQKQESKLFIINTLPRIILEFSCLLFIVVFIALNITSESSFTNIIPILTLIVIAAVRMIPSFTQISTNYNRIKFDLHTIEKINKEIINWMKNEKDNISSNNNLFKSFEKDLHFKNISFSYENNKHILKDLSFNINKGEKVALFGKSGSGKTTLSDIFLGLFPPSQGSIICDGKDIKKDIKSWRKLLTYVPQNVVLFDDTIKKNICFNFNETKFNEKKYLNALKISGLDKIIDDFPDKDNSNVGFLASKVSGGQKQRIGIARAVYRNKPIIVLDEATNSLDKKSEDEILQNLFSDDCTILFISHDKEKIKLCDKVIDLNDIQK